MRTTKDRRARSSARAVAKKPAPKRRAKASPVALCARKLQELIVTDPAASAKLAGLRYVHDQEPGICRKRAGKSFTYRTPDGKPVRDEATLARIKALGIPPAWTDVWICTAENGHLQATGRDAKGRKQYRYHARWREVRDETKYHRMIAFGAALPVIRARTEADLALHGLPREKVLATVVRLLEATLIRVGNEEYARANQSYGLTTLRDEHVSVEGEVVKFHFVGKHGKEHTVGVRDRRLARIVQRCSDVPGEELFQYVDADGTRHCVHSEDVNQYLHAITGAEYTAKDFRTWSGTVLAAQELRGAGAFGSKTEAKRIVATAIAKVAERLGNTRTICQKCYVHPEVVAAYHDGTLVEELAACAELRLEAPYDALKPEEALVVSFLQRRLLKAVPEASARLAA